jgi:hypothetical protein
MDARDVEARSSVGLARATRCAPARAAGSAAYASGGARAVRACLRQQIGSHSITRHEDGLLGEAWRNGVQQNLRKAARGTGRGLLPGKHAPDSGQEICRTTPAMRNRCCTLCDCAVRPLTEKICGSASD